MMSVQSGRKRLLLSKLNEQLTCKLCSGYFIDATTIIECLHSFCRSCIVKYLEKSKYCPICEVQVHKSKPLLNIRPDYTLQDIVYKLVPGCYQNEMRYRREFYANHPDEKTDTIPPESKGEPVESHIYSPDESLNLSLEYHNPNIKTESEDEEVESATKVLPRRYLRCPAAVTIFHIQKLIRAKYGLSDAHKVDILYKEEPLCSTYTLMDIMYIYHWRRKVPLHLSYRIFESSSKRIKLTEDNAELKQSLSDSGICQIELNNEQPYKEWKEVQLKISETGVMSVTDITNADSKRNVSTLELDDIGKSDYNSILDKNLSKDLMEQDFKSANDVLKDKCKLKKEENEGTVTRSATKLNASKVEESKLKIDDKILNTKMDTRSSLKEGKLTKEVEKNIKDTKSDSQILTNNNSINSGKESENTKHHMKPSNAGSKINALSAKLQFQPKVGPVSNTYSKKGSLKDKKTSYNLKSSDNKLSKSITKVDAKITESPKAQNIPKINSDETIKTSLVSSVTLTTTAAIPNTSASTSTITTSTSTPTIPVSTVKSVSSTTLPSKTLNIARTSMTKSTSPIISTNTTTPLITTTASSTITTTSQVSNKNTSSIYPTIQTTATSTPISENSTTKISQCNITQPMPKVQTSSEKCETKSTIITSAISTDKTNSPVISHMIKDMVKKQISSPEQKSCGVSVTCSKNSTTASSTSNSNSTSSHFNIQIPVTSVSSTSIKNNSINNSESNTITTTCNIPNSNISISNSTPCSTASTTVKIANDNSSVVSTDNIVTSITRTSFTATTTMTTATIKTEPKSDTIPPCPDAIPLSMMKTTMRKNQLLLKNTNSLDSSVKISTPGSKIDDICAKIGENSKEKNKLENRSKPEIPGLLEIPKKSSPPAEQILKQIPSIHVPIFKPSNKESNLNCTDSYKTLPSISSHSLQSNISTTNQKVSTTKKRVSHSSYKTLRNSPRSWNQALSKNTYLALKNQAKELQQHQHQQVFPCGSKQIPSKSPKIFTMRNTPRYLGNPASGVKPMYNIATDVNKEKEQSTSTPGSSKGHTVSMTKIDPQTLQPIVSMVPSSPYITNERTYQSGPFSSRDIRSTSSPVSPRNSPVNMFSTSPFIPSPTPNTNPRLIYSTFPPTFPNTNRFRHPIMPHSTLGLPPPLSAFHSRLPQVQLRATNRWLRHRESTSENPTDTSDQPLELAQIPENCC